MTNSSSNFGRSSGEREIELGIISNQFLPEAFYEDNMQEA